MKPAMSKKMFFSIAGLLVSSFLFSMLYFCILILLSGCKSKNHYSEINYFSMDNLFFYVLVSPVFEEFIFRRILPGLFSKNNLLLGNLISAILFSFSHYLDFTYEWGLINYIFAFILGVYLSSICVFNGNKILYPIMAHAFVNYFILYSGYFIEKISLILCW